MRRDWLLASLVALVGCSTTPVQSDKAVPVPAERIFAHSAGGKEPDIVVTRDAGALGSGCKVGVYIDGQIAATFKAGETAGFSLAPGQHLIGVGNDPNRGGLCAMGSMALREKPVTIPADKFRRWRISTDMNSGADIAPSSM